MSDFSNENRVYDKPLPKTALDEYKLSIFAPIAGSKRKSALRVSTANNQPKIVVFTGIEGDPKNGYVAARLDTLSFIAILEAMRIVILGEKNAEGKYRRFDIPCKHPIKGGSEFVIDAYVTLGREEDDGRIFMAVTGNNVTPIKFHHGPADCHDGWLENKQPIDVRVVSELYANAWCRTFSELVIATLNDNYTPPPPREPNNWQGNKPAPAQKSTPNTDNGGSDDDFFN